MKLLSTFSIFFNDFSAHKFILVMASNIPISFILQPFFFGENLFSFFGVINKLCMFNENMLITIFVCLLMCTVVYCVGLANKHQWSSEQPHLTMYSIDGNHCRSNVDWDGKGQRNWCWCCWDQTWLFENLQSSPRSWTSHQTLFFANSCHLQVWFREPNNNNITYCLYC